MAIVLANRARMTVSSGGTGTFTLLSAASGHQTLAQAGVTDGQQVRYGAENSDRTKWEVGLGTYTSSGLTLSRDTIYDSSNAGSAVSFSGGDVEVWVDASAETFEALQPLDAGLTDIAALAVTDGNIIVGDGSNWVAESGNTARTSLGLGTGDSPTFAGVSLVGDLNIDDNTIIYDDDTQGTIFRLADGTQWTWHDATGGVDRATLDRASGDLTITGDLLLASGNKIDFASGDVTLTHVAASGSIVINADVNNDAADTVISLGVDGNGEALLSATAFYPGANDGNALGTTDNGWSDLYLASTATVHFGNTDWVATHSTGVLTVGTGDLRVTNNFTNATSVVTLAGAQTLTNKTIGVSQLSGQVSVANGGTGQSTEAEAIGELVQALTADATPDWSADYVPSYDASADTGKKLLLNTVWRERLTTTRTYYVRTDGSDSNTGLVDSAGGAFLTIQKAVDTVATLDIAGNAVTIQVGDGTYTATTALRNVVGFAAAGNLIIQGNSGTPANVIISTTSAAGFSASGLYSIWDVRHLKIQTTTSGSGVLSQHGSTIRLNNIDFGACASSHVNMTFGAKVIFTGNYAITGNAPAHWWSLQQGLVDANFRTITLTGTPAFSTAFALGQTLGLIQAAVMTFSGSATGPRYSVTSNAVIDTLTGNATYFPGNAAGSTTTGGQYS